MQKELRVLRDRGALQNEELDRADPGDRHCSGAIVATTTTVASYPTSAGVFYACNPTEVGGANVEGGAASYSAGGDVVYCLNAGTAVPPSGTRVIASAVGGRWVFRYDG